jgi:hypothetical protein
MIRLLGIGMILSFWFLVHGFWIYLLPIYKHVLLRNCFCAKNAKNTIVYVDNKHRKRFLISRNQKPETRNQKPETRNQKPETRNQKPET